MADDSVSKTNKFKLKNGHVILKAFANRKLARAYNAAMYKDVKSDTDEEGKSKFNIPIENLELSKEVLVLGMIKEAVIDGEAVEVTQDFIDDLHADDFALLADVCRDMAFPTSEEEKKTS